jgi:hypothetical protein
MGEREETIVEISVGAPADTVWQALRDPEQIANWFGWDAETLAEEIQYIFFDHSVTDEAKRTITSEEFPGGIVDRIEVQAADSGAVVRVVRSGAAPEGGWDAVYDDIIEGWITFFQQLRFLVERHPGGKRRTVFLSGERQSSGPLPVETLGLSGVSRLTLPVGDATDEAWHRGTHQVGVTVPDWGDGLLVVTDKPAPNGGDYGGGSALLTTFGLGDADFAAIEKRWIGWWAERFPPA